MGIYAEQVLPRVLNVMCAVGEAKELRQRACAGLHGEVVELGFGSGLNVPHYPGAVTRVHAIEPSDTAWKLASKRLAVATAPVERSGLDGQRLPLPDDSCDTALSSWTLCTIPDLASALAEVRRVLKPGGTLHFIEHGLAPDEKVRHRQHQLEPLQKRFAGGCHLTRQIPALLTDAGFEVTELDEFYEKGAPKVLAADSLGIAISP
jgi:ubiquinone/menaquinone biosynthesis C-methylase UbiE